MVLVEMLILALGFSMLLIGADWFVDGASALANKLHISQMVIGLTVVAMGTSVPEVAVSINAAMSNDAGISIGNVVGSNIFNVLVILGVSSIISSCKIGMYTLYLEIPFMIVVTLILLAMGYTGAKISMAEGIILWILFIIYLLYMLWLAKVNVQEVKMNDKPLLSTILKITFGIAVVIVGSDFVVDNAVKLAMRIGMSERFIGLTIVAMGTSLPELVTSVNAAKKNNADIAIGNIVGSNIFNILFILGTASFISEISFEKKFLFDTIVAVLAGALLWISVIKERHLKRTWGILFMIVYGVYLFYSLFM